MRILITGANGTVGQAILSELGDHEEYEFTCLDKDSHPNRETIVADITDYDDIRPHFDGHDAVIHLAAIVDLSGSWDEILQANFVGTYNVLQAAAEAEVEQFIFASSIHTVGMCELDLAPELYDPDYDLEIDHEVPVQPDSFYGVSKIFGESLGRLFIESHENPLADVHPAFATNTRDFPKRFYSLRIKSVRDAEHDHPYGLAEEGVEADLWTRASPDYEYMAERLKATWLSHRDLGQLVDRCLQDETVDFDIFWGVSDNDATWVDLSHTREVLGYQPEDNGAEWTGPPTEN
ncbi:NAD-dependent epimerase/dehydratase family protein [Haladaptatus sp. NG-WS-4]